VARSAEDPAAVGADAKAPRVGAHRADERAPGAQTTPSNGSSSGVGGAAKAVAEDVSALVRAEIDLAKAELTEGAKAKATGAGLLMGTAVMGWLALQGLLITAGLALALVLPGWAAALIVSVVLLLIGGILALIARPKLQAPVGVSEAREQTQRDVELAKARLQAPRTRQQVQEDIAWTKSRVTGK
jgi:uncharacterized membrane protein YqjE